MRGMMLMEFWRRKRSTSFGYFTHSFKNNLFWFILQLKSMSIDWLDHNSRVTYQQKISQLLHVYIEATMCEDDLFSYLKYLLEAVQNVVNAYRFLSWSYKTFFSFIYV